MKQELLKSKTGRVLIESHRGAEGLATENSFSALKLGLEAGADFLEVDIQLSRDSVPFLHHNYTLPDGRWCFQTPWDEIRLLANSDSFLPLEDVLIWARENDACLSLDLKVGFMPENELATEVLALLERTQTLDHVMLISWDHVELLNIKRSYPNITTRALIRGRLVDYTGFLKYTQADAISLTYGVVRSSDVEQVHQAGVAIVMAEMWKPDFKMVRDLDIDIVSWNNPKEAKQMLKHA